LLVTGNKMWILATVIMLNVWAVTADDVLSSKIDIIEELQKIKTVGTRMEKEMERLKTENEGNVTVS